MISGVCKALSIGIVAYCATSGLKDVDKQIDRFSAIPKRVMTVFELKQLQRLIQYELVGNSDSIIRMTDFCEKNLEAAGRDPGQDYWKTPYRLFFDGILYDENSSVSLGYNDSDKYVVVSAGQDKHWYSEDDLTSKSATDNEVKRLTEQIEEEVKKAEEKEKK